MGVLASAGLSGQLPVRAGGPSAPRRRGLSTFSSRAYAARFRPPKQLSRSAAGGSGARRSTLGATQRGGRHGTGAAFRPAGRRIAQDSRPESGSRPENAGDAGNCRLRVAELGVLAADLRCRDQEGGAIGRAENRSLGQAARPGGRSITGAAPNLCPSACGPRALVRLQAQFRANLASWEDYAEGNDGDKGSAFTDPMYQQCYRASASRTMPRYGHKLP